MFSWFKKKPETAKTEVVPIYHWSAEEIPRYPPFMKGLPTVDAKRLIETQAELIAKLRNLAVSTPVIFDRYYVPLINRFAAFAHLLPASETHHHRGAGGLLRHSLEVGFWSLQAADKIMIGAGSTPGLRREMEPRWHLAAFIAGLCHDAGKPMTDLIVTNHTRSTVWKPLKEDLCTWAEQNKVDAYYIDWRAGRAKQHTALSSLIADRIIGSDALEWISEGGTDLIVWLVESLNNNPSPTNPIYDLVCKADQLSVERDLKTVGAVMAGYDIGVPIERHLTDIMRRLVKEGVWMVNEPGARVWCIDSHVYLIWPAAGEEIAREVRESGMPGISRSPDGILDMLVDRGLAFVRDNTEGDRMWRIAPACLTEKIPKISLSAIRLRDDSLLSSSAIPSVEGKLLSDRSAANAAEEEENSPKPKPAPSLGTESQGTDQPQPKQHAIATPSITKEVEEGQGKPESQSAIQGESKPKAGESKRPKSAENMVQHGSVQSTSVTGKNNLEEVASPTRKDSESDAPPCVEPDPSQQATAPVHESAVPVTLDGAIGEALNCLVQDLASGAKKLDRDAEFRPGSVLLRWPDAFAGYGLSGKTILDELVLREWIWTDPMAPLKRVLDGQVNGQEAKHIRLTKPISVALTQALKKLNPDSGAGLPPPNKTPDTRTLPMLAETQERCQEAFQENSADLLRDISDTPPAKPMGTKPAKDPSAKAKRKHEKNSPHTPEQQSTAEKRVRTKERVEVAPPEATSLDRTTEKQPSGKPGAMPQKTPTTKELLGILAGLDAVAEEDGWKSYKKSAVIGAANRQNWSLTHAKLANLVSQSKSLAIEGGMVRAKI